MELFLSFHRKSIKTEALNNSSNISRPRRVRLVQQGRPRLTDITHEMLSITADESHRHQQRGEHQEVARRIVKEQMEK